MGPELRTTVCALQTTLWRDSILCDLDPLRVRRCTSQRRSSSGSRVGIGGNALLRQENASPAYLQHHGRTRVWMAVAYAHPRPGTPGANITYMAPVFSQCLRQDQSSHDGLLPSKLRLPRLDHRRRPCLDENRSTAICMRLTRKLGSLASRLNRAATTNSQREEALHRKHHLHQRRPYSGKSP